MAGLAKAALKTLLSCPAMLLQVALPTMATFFQSPVAMLPSSRDDTLQRAGCSLQTSHDLGALPTLLPGDRSTEHINNNVESHIFVLVIMQILLSVNVQ